MRAGKLVSLVSMIFAAAIAIAVPFTADADTVDTVPALAVGR